MELLQLLLGFCLAIVLVLVSLAYSAHAQKQKQEKEAQQKQEKEDQQKQEKEKWLKLPRYFILKHTDVINDITIYCIECRSRYCVGDTTTVTKTDKLPDAQAILKRLLNAGTSHVYVELDENGNPVK